MLDIHILRALISADFIINFKKTGSIIKLYELTRYIKMVKRKVNVAWKDRTPQIQTIVEKCNSTDAFEHYKRSMITAFDAEIFIQVGFLDGHSNDAIDIKETIFYLDYEWRGVEWRRQKPLK